MSNLENSDIVSIIFQPNPTRDIVHYWLNAEKGKRIIPRDSFISLALKVQPSIASAIREACNTYSFYLWDAEDKLVVKLTHRSSKDDVLNPIGLYFNSVLSGREVKSDVTDYSKPRTLEEYLVGFGFEPLDNQKLQNLDIKLRKISQESRAPKKVGFFRRRRFGT